MSHAQARAAINAVIAQIQAGWTAYPLKVETDNRDLVDYAAQQKPFLQVEVVNLDGEQADLGTDAWTCQEGQILLSAVSRTGSGTADAAALLDFAIGFFHRKVLAGLVHCESAVAVRGKTFNEWWYEPAVVPFWYHWK